MTDAGLGRRVKVRHRSVTLSPCHLVTLSLTLAVGCNWPGKPNPADKPKLPDQVVQAGPLFGQHCAGCHGAEGKLGPAPPLNDPLFRAIIPEAALLRVITDGRPGTPMAAFGQEKGGPLTVEQVRALAKGIKEGIEPDWGPPARPEETVPPYHLPAKATGDRKAGEAVFAGACAMCHGEDGRGGPKTVGAVHDRAFLALTSDQVLRRIVITGRHDLGMPRPTGEKDKPLTDKQVNDVVALLAHWRGRPFVPDSSPAKPAGGEKEEDAAPPKRGGGE
jgi:cytochrome c oxidase cbb3-type subunit 3